MRSRRAFVILVAVVLIAGGLVLAYGMTMPVNARSALADALHRTQKVRSAHVVMDMKASAPFPISFHEEGDIVFPDRMHMNAVINGQAFEFIMIGNTYYFRELPDGQWQKETRAAQWQTGSLGWQNGSFPQFMFEPGNTGEPSGSWMKVERLPDDVVAGVPCERYKVSFDVERMAEALKEEAGEKSESISMLEEYAGSVRMEGEYCVGTQDRLIRFMRYHAVMPAEMMQRMARIGNMEFPKEALSRQVEITMVMYYSDFNKPVRIEPPVLAPSSQGE